MIDFLTFYLLLTVCLAARRSVDYGVGFSLSLDYGYVLAKISRLPPSILTFSPRTCSIYFANGSAVDVAKIEGNARYQEAMRHIAAPDKMYHPTVPTPNRNHFFCSLQHHVPRSPLLRTLFKGCDALSPDAAALGPMLYSLRAAAETYLGHPIQVADTAVAKSLPQARKQVIKSAYRSFGLKYTANFSPAGMVAAMANGFGPILSASRNMLG